MKVTLKSVFSWQKSCFLLKTKRIFLKNLLLFKIDYDTVQKPQVDVQSLIISTRKTKKGLMKTNVYKDNEKSFSPLAAPLHTTHTTVVVLVQDIWQ